MGWIVAYLKQEGTHPADKEELIADTAELIIGKTFKNREDGVTSRGLEEGFIFLVKSIESCKLIGKSPKR